MRWMVGLLAIAAACGDDASTKNDAGGGDGALQPDAPAIGATSCDPLPMPSGNIIDVTPADAANLGNIVLGAQAGDVIRLADGTYNVSASVGMNISKPNVTLISASRDASKVILDGGAHVSKEIIQISASNVTVAHITIKNARDHLVHLYPGAGADLHGDMLYGLVLVDGGQQFVKSNTDKSNAEFATAHFVDDVTVACSTFTMTSAGRAYVPTNPDNSSYPCYTGGIDAHAARGWLVRRNRFEGIYCDVNSLAEHAIHFWQTGRDQIIEQNTLVENARGIGLGLGDGTGLIERPYADNPHASDKSGSYAGNYDGIIRNNFVYASVGAADCGICLEQAMGTKVLNNTVFYTGSAPGNAIEYRFPNSLVTFDNTIANIIKLRDSARGTAGRLLAPQASLFAAPASGDLHLNATATGAIDQGGPLADVTDDIDGESRGNPPDLGADER
ncbi:MAG TPA: hypothetical protein VL326_01630 [Kofleriaceae bacterium]|jgi:hypothetical protein|nr:hypothetical protein [Kofleriaceae bacterium]